MSSKYKILFLGETYRADAITWMNGLLEFGPFEIETWELEESGIGFKKIKRAIEVVIRLRELKRKIIKLKPDLIIAERATSYGFIATLFHKYAPVIIAQQGITDIYPTKGITALIKNKMQHYAYKHATLIHAWGEIMTYSMLRSNTDPNKIMILAKGINLRQFKFTPEMGDEKIRAVITRSLSPEYGHETILQAFDLLKQKELHFELTIIGKGILKQNLIQSASDKNLEKEVFFKGIIPNSELPSFLSNQDLYISMPTTEGVSASLFEAMAVGCFPIVSDLPGNRAWITDKINGRLIPVNDARQLADAILWYYENKRHLKPALLKNREMIELKANYEKNMKIICNRYLDLITIK